MTISLLDIQALLLSGTNIAGFVPITHEKARDIPSSTGVYGNRCGEMIQTLLKQV
jgi:hypothetical protein